MTDERGQKVQKWVDIGDIGEKAGYMHVLLSQLQSVHYNSPKRPNWTVLAVLPSCVVCSIIIISTLELYMHMCFSLLCWVSTVACYDGSCESYEESHLTQSHNDWSAETTLFLTLVALCFSEKMLGFRPPCEIFVNVTCSLYHCTIFLEDDLPRVQSEGWRCSNDQT